MGQDEVNRVRFLSVVFFFQEEAGIGDVVRLRGLGNGLRGGGPGGGAGHPRDSLGRGMKYPFPCALGGPGRAGGRESCHKCSGICVSCVYRASWRRSGICLELCWSQLADVQDQAWQITGGGH